MSELCYQAAYLWLQACPTSNDKSGEQIAGSWPARRRPRGARRKWIAGRVSVNGAVINSPALNVTAKDRIASRRLNPADLSAPGCSSTTSRHAMTTHADHRAADDFARAAERPAAADQHRPARCQHRGLLLLATTAGWRACWIAGPPPGCAVTACATAVTQEQLDRLRAGITVEGVRYGPVEPRSTANRANVWLTFAIREGGNLAGAQGFGDARPAHQPADPGFLWAVRAGRTRRQRREVETAALRNSSAIVAGPARISRRRWWITMHDPPSVILRCERAKRVSLA